MAYRNRIIHYGVKNADQFLAHPSNARIHPQFQRDVMKSALTDIGFVAPVIESKSGYLLDGHERVYQALENNSAIPFVQVDVDEDEESYILATFDPIAGLANYDIDLLDDLLSTVHNSDVGHDLDWLDGLLKGDNDLETSNQIVRPAIHERKEAKRQFVSGLKKQALNDLIPELPPPSTDLYIIGNGAGAEIKHGINPLAFDFGTFIPHIVQMLGNKNCVAYVSSWTMNRTHVKALFELYDEKALSQITVCTDPYFKRREAAIANELIIGLTERKQRFLAFKNHVKCIAISNPDGECCTITGSANLSAQPRCEQYVLSTAPDVYAFFRDTFFEAMFANAK
jgi:hypothetical protein